MNWETIRRQIEQDDQGKWDTRLQAGNLRYEAGGRLAVGTNGDRQVHPLSELALSQLCHRLGIPVRYFKRLPGEMQVELANYDLRRLSENGLLLRGRGRTIRAVLSDRYVAYNHSQVIEAVAGTVGSDGLLVKSFVLEERFMFLKLLSPTLADETLELKAGVMISNSEVGLAQVSVEPFLYRKPCTNDLIVAEQAAFRHRHVVLSTAEFTLRVGESIAQGLKLAQAAVSAAWAAEHRQVHEPQEMICRLVGEWKLGKPFAELVLAAYQAEPRPTRFGIANSFTRAAQRLEAASRIEVERLAGKLLAA